jgi:putative zinc finger/helix-turn-helix YgiT family protein
MGNSMKCSVCGGSTREVKESKKAKYRDEVVEVETTLFRCDACKEGFVTPQQLRNHTRAVKNEVRKRLGLLPAEAIVAVRQKLGLTQGALEDALGTGPKMVVRWESGKVIQSRGHDNMLRLLDREPSTLKSLQQIQKLRCSEQEKYERSVSSSEGSRAL